MKKGYIKALIFLAIIFSLIFFLSDMDEFKITGKVVTQDIKNDDIAQDYPTLAVDSKGIVHVVHRNNTKNYYCNNTEGSWNCEIMVNTNQPSHFSIAVDSNDKVHVSYSNGTIQPGLGYCNNTLGSWTCEFAHQGTNRGWYSSIAIDSNDNVHVSHADNGLDYILHCQKSGTSWSCPTVLTDTSGSLYNEIAIDSNNKVHIVGMKTFISPKYCNNVLGSWSCINIDSEYGIYPSIAVDSNDKVHIAHANGSNGNYGLRYCNNTQGSWSCIQIENNSGGGSRSSMAIDLNDKVHISHHGDNGNGDLRYCNNIQNIWNCETIGDADSSTLGDPRRAIAIKKGRLVDSTQGSDVHIAWSAFGNLKYTLIDSTGPSINFGNDSDLEGNYSKNNIIVNITSEDLGVGLENITLYLYNSTYLINQTINSMSPLFLNFTNLADGIYYINATSNDSEGNLNQTLTRKIILDTKSPSIAFSCDSELMNQNDALICTCISTDSGVGVNSTLFTEKPSTSATGSFSTSCTAIDYLGNNITSIWNYLVDPPLQSSSSSGGSNLESLGGTPTASKTSLLVNIESGKETKVSTFQGTGIKEISIIINQQVQNIRIEVKKYDSKPIEVSKEVIGKRYRYLQIETGDLNENLDSANIEFEVEKSWLNENELTTDEVSIFKFDNQTETWNELDTIYEREENGTYVYSIEINSFSFFAVAEKSKPSLVEEIVDAVAESYETAGETVFGLIVWWLIVAILAVGIVLVGFSIAGLLKSSEKDSS